MKSLSAFIIATVGISLVWVVSGLVPFVVFTLPNIEGIIAPGPGELALLGCCFAGGAVVWSVLSAEIAALAGYRIAVGWTVFQTAVLTIALPVLGNSLPMLMLLMSGLGCLTGTVWSVWFPIVLEVDYRVRPGAVAAFFVSLYTAAAVLIPASVELVKMLGSLQAMAGLGGIAFVGACATMVMSKRMLRISRQIAPVSFFRMDRQDMGALANMSFIFLLLFCLPALMLLVQTLTQTVLIADFADTFRLEPSALAWIAGIAWVPALVLLLISMPTIRHGVPLRYFGLGLAISAGAMVLVALATNQIVFVAAYLGAYIGVGLCWGAYYACVSASVPRDARLPALIVGGLGLAAGLGVAGGFQWTADVLNLGGKLTVLSSAGIVGGVGLLTLLASLIAALNGAHQGGHFDDDHPSHVGNFKKFTYGNPQG